MELITDPLKRFESFFSEFVDENNEKKYRDLIRSLALQNKKSLIINFNDLFKFDSQLARELIIKPDEYIKIASDGIKNVLKEVDIDYYNQRPECIARFSNLDEDHTILLRKLRAEHIGRLIQVQGILNRASIVKPQIINASFYCEQCRETFFIEQEGYQFKKPLQCENEACRRKGPFKFLPENSIFIDWQKISIQESPEALPAGQLPRTIDAILLKDLVDIARPGANVAIIGILRSSQDSTGKGKLTTFHTYLEANNITVLEKELEEDITDQDEKRIKDLAQDPLIHEKIIKSIAPSIYGNHDIKEAICYLLFGGRSKELPDGMKIRGDTHILLVGDPGTGKSQLLQSVKEIAPRGLYTSGKGSTAAGLTAAVMRDRDTGEMTLEAGALVISDMGIACIDEFDKMNPQDRVAIHEAMEQQTVSIAKAGILANLNARTSILAAANPTYGRYDDYKNVAENIKKLPVSILSRFDLIFILRDIPDAEKDARLAEHILELHQELNPKSTPEIVPDLLNKYIRYARKNVKPVLQGDAQKRINDFYLEMRGSGESENSPIAISSRQLEGLIRLAEAHARMALRNDVNLEDAESAIRIMTLSLRQVGVDRETGSFDISAVTTGQFTSQRNKILELEKIIEELTQEKGGPVSTENILDVALSRGIEKEFVERGLEDLQRKGVIFKPYSDHWKKA
ncbi:MAG: minichromosome maintenance protein MCM [Promethearchaeota archaeon]